jgi:hypothetical protein
VTRLFWAVLLPLFLLSLMFGAPAYADDPTPAARAEAGTRFNRGVKLFEAQDYSAALAEFEAAYKLAPAFQVLFNIGVAQKKLFRYNDAVRTFARYLKDGGDKVAPDRREAVERELAEIRSLVAEVTVTVDGMPATIEVDSRVVGETPLSDPLLLPSGKHTVRAIREGDLPASKDIEVVSGEKIEVALAPQPKPAVPTTAKLSLTSKPAGATLFLDGKSVGNKPWTGDVGPGGHEIRGELAGYQRARTELMLTAGQQRELVLEMMLLPPPKKWHQRTSTWVIAGLVVAGAVAASVAGYYATRETFVEVSYPGSN